MTAKKKEFFLEMREALQEAISYKEGSAPDLRVTKLPPPPKRMRPAEIRAIRQKLNASQVTFAKLINVSPNAVESWEQGIRKPTSAALKLLKVAQRHPEILLET